MPEENYALEAAKQLNEIGFAEFTSDLITKTFEALIDANLRQTESYINLVKEMTKSLSAYINDTKLEISNQEVLDHLGSLPKFVNDQGEPIKNQSGVTAATTAAELAALPPVSLASNEEVKSTDINAINKNFTVGQLASNILQVAGKANVANLVKDGLGLVSNIISSIPAANPKKNQIKNAIFPATQNQDYYDPVAFKSLMDDPDAATAALVPQTVQINDVAIGKLYDSVAEVIAGDKYSLLQEMVKLGVVRVLAKNGRIRTMLTFSSYERASKSSSTYEKHSETVKDKYKQRQAPSRGILRLIRNRPLEKTKKTERDVHVRTTSEQTASAQGTNITIFGGVEIYFETDYLPVAQA